MKINKLNEGLRVIENFLVTNVTKGAGASGQTYLTISLQDNTGQIEGKVWDADEEDFLLYKPGNIIKVIADVIEYRNNLQLKIVSAESVNVSSVKLQDFTIASPVSLDHLTSELARLIASITDKEIHQLVSHIFDKYYDDFIVYPAASKVHHEYTHGLLEHTITLANLADRIIGYYQELYQGNWIVNRDLVIAGTLVHDLGKVIELSGPVLTNYTVEGKLLGHISIVNAIIQENAKALGMEGEIVTLLSHIVLAHHAKLEFGSPVLPLTKEALLVSKIDEMDADMKILEKALQATEEGEFTDRIWPLNNNSFYRQKSRK